MARKKAATDPNAPAKSRGRPKKEKTVITNVNPDAVVQCFVEVNGMLSDRARLDQRIAKTYERFEKSDGVDRKAIKEAIRLSKSDPAAAKAQLDRNREYAEILEITDIDDAGQTGLSEDFAPREPKKPSADQQALLARARASTDGYNTGFVGGSLDNNPHVPGTSVHQEWAIGFHDGHAERLAQNPDADKVVVASTSRKRRQPKQTDLEDAIEGAEETFDIAAQERALADTEAAGTA